MFGIPMQNIMVALVIITAICLSSVAFIAWRNRTMFLMGLRNIPRRKAQTILIVFGDEPTGALDSESAGDIMDLLQRLNAEEGQTIVMVTHDPAIGARAHRIVRFRDGEIVGEERPARNGVAAVQHEALPVLALA